MLATDIIAVINIINNESDEQTKERIRQLSITDSIMVITLLNISDIKEIT